MARGGNGIGAVVSALARSRNNGGGGESQTGASDTGATVDTATGDTSAA